MTDLNQNNQSLFDIDGVQNDVNRRAIAIGIDLIFVSGFMTWIDVDFDDNSGFNLDFSESLKGPSEEDTRDEYENAGYLWFLSIIGLGAIILRKDKLTEHIGDENYGNFFLALGLLCALLAFTTYNEVTENIEDFDDEIDDLEKIYEDSIDAKAEVKIGFYVGLIGPLGVLYGAYNIYNDQKAKP